MKFFNTKRITKKELRKRILLFAKQQGVLNLTFSYTGKRVCGTYNSHKKSIFISLKQNKKQMLTTLFHELGHHQAACKNKWKKYHFNLVQYMKLETIFDIENKIDKIGRKLWYKYVDLKQWGKYKYFYPKKYKNLYMKTTNASL